ncbi:NfeD family protein [Paraglaciecola sp. MB-3u-78]|uniref:NfeD family protein n=1 Tax=Paraglaciecola sp. MB-3u-78 TaxID=2058332 RepID=UPI000C32F741|nr:NfeD family protein [Paraglaciecola sp. MB-3u-78]PKG98002.1 activity regulator of membrane protease YbbK [Paraglaciecola sp. MB-3u-78]
MDWAFNNLAESLLILGILLLVIEVAVLGFSTFVLFFVGCAAVVTAGLLYVGFIPDTWLSAMLSTGVLTGLSAVLLWKPLKNMQTQVDTTKAQGDLVGHRFILLEDVAPELTPEYHYSGIDWKLKSNEHLVAGTQVEVTQADVGEFHIKAS